MTIQRLRVLCAGALVCLGATITVTVVALGIWLHASPRLTLRAMADAASRNDAEALSAYIDMRAMRRNALSRVARAIEAESHGTGVRMRGNRAAEAVAGHVLDEHLSIRHLRQAMRRSPARGDTIIYRISRAGMDRFYVSILLPHRLNLEFTRHGAGWLMTDMWSDGPERNVVA